MSFKTDRTVLTSLFINFHRFPAHFTIEGSILATPSLLKLHLVVVQLTRIELASASGKARRAGPHLQVDPGAEQEISLDVTLK